MSSAMRSSSALRSIPPATARDGQDLRDTPYGTRPSAVASSRASVTRSGETRLSWSAFALRPAWAVIPVTLPRKRHNIRYVGG